MEDYLDQAPCCFFSFNDHGILLAVNQTVCHLSGYSKEELLGQHIELILTLPSRIFYQTHLFPLLKLDSKAEEIFISLLTKNQERIPLLMNAKRIAAGNVMQNQCVGIVVHNRKKFEDELVAAKHAAERAVKENTELIKIKEELLTQKKQLDENILVVIKQNAEMKQFNRVVTHDLQEPMRKISMFSNMLLDHTKKPDQDFILQKLTRVTAQLRQIVSGLQQFVWLNEAEMNLGPVNINALLLTVQEKIEEEKKDQPFELVSEALPSIVADREQLFLLFYQLLMNAVNFKKPEQNARVCITGTIIKQNRFKKLRDQYSYEDFLRLQVSDNGVGFDPQYRQQVFELFKKLHHPEGRGLGLSLCKIITENHGGRIEADSETGKGTTITIWLPIEGRSKESSEF